MLLPGALFTHQTAISTVASICGGRLRKASRGLSEPQAEVIARVMTGLSDLALGLPEVDISLIRTTAS